MFLKHFLFLEVLMMEIRERVTISYLNYKKRVPQKSEKVILQEIETLKFNSTIHFSILDETKAFLKIYEKKKNCMDILLGIVLIE